jgi:hypothetical protein
MHDASSPTVAAAHDPVFVLGERAAAVQLVRALGETEGLYALPFTRLLTDLVAAVDRCYAMLGPATDVPWESLAPAAWYRDVQAACLGADGKWRTVEYSGLSILRLCTLFPGAQFVVVRQLRRAMPPSRRLPALEHGRIIEIDSDSVGSPETLDLVLDFLGQPVRVLELDLSDQPLPSPSS